MKSWASNRRGLNLTATKPSDPQGTLTRQEEYRLGDGPPVIVVGGAMCDRALTSPTAEELAKHFTVLNYDRRGDSGHSAVEREIEDIGALIVEAGGTASAELAGRVSTETLVLVGGSSPAWTIDIGRQVADTLPNGKHRVLEGQEHVVPPEVLVPVLAEFFARRNKPDSWRRFGVLLGDEVGHLPGHRGWRAARLGCARTHSCLQFVG